MKKHLAVLAATAVLGVTSAFAANPFSDVTPQDWAYQAVAQLASQGVVNGYPDGTFQGQHNITRFEMAQMVAKAMARQGQVDAEQNAIINRLANEFSAELNNLGVRVSTLENKVGNFKFTGDARLKFTGTSSETSKFSINEKATKEEEYLDYKTDKKSTFDYRGRVQFEGTVNEDTKAVIRLTASKEFGEAGNPKTTIDRVYVKHNFGKYATATVGRHDVKIGAGLTYDSVFEGATVMAGKDALNASFTYGYAPGLKYKAVVGSTNDKPGTDYFELPLSENEQKDNPQLAIVQLNGKIGNHVKAGAFYTKVILPGYLTKNLNKSLNFYGVNASVDLGHKVNVNGEFAKFKDFKASKAWTAGISYGDYNMKKQGTWMVKAQYVNLDTLAPVFDSTHWTPYNQNFKTWSLQGKYAVANNVGLAAYTTINAKDQDGNKVSNFYRAELNYAF